LLQRGSDALNIYAAVESGGGGVHRLGLGKEGSRWIGRLDGETATIGKLVRVCPVTSFDPGSHALIAGAAEERRRFMDWGVFHVEHDFLQAWRRYQRALKQRNALLRSGSLDPAVYVPWELELAEQGWQISEWRRQYLEALAPLLAAQVAATVPELGQVSLHYRQGWHEDAGLKELLESQRARDQARGHTTIGSHRADWSLSYENAPLREHLSRGQEKLTALACLLAQARLHAQAKGEWPVVCLDDLASELDASHQQALIEQLLSARAQFLITGTERPRGLGAQVRMFHVEQGAVTPLL
jgi:DNA replication and repair protein RecF